MADKPKYKNCKSALMLNSSVLWLFSLSNGLKALMLWYEDILARPPEDGAMPDGILTPIEVLDSSHYIITSKNPKPKWFSLGYFKMI